MTNAFKVCALLFMAGISDLKAGTASNQAILIKKTSSGFLPAEWKRQETCEVFVDRIVITRLFGGSPSLTSVETRSSRLAGDYDKILKDASQAKIATSSSTTIDGPSYEYIGQITGGKATDIILLKKEDGANGVVSMNPSSAANLLVNALDGICPEVFK